MSPVIPRPQHKNLYLFSAFMEETNERKEEKRKPTCETSESICPQPFYEEMNITKKTLI